MGPERTVQIKKAVVQLVTAGFFSVLQTKYIGTHELALRSITVKFNADRYRFPISESCKTKLEKSLLLLPAYLYFCRQLQTGVPTRLTKNFEIKLKSPN
jgi:hypothetical protein